MPTNPWFRKFIIFWFILCIVILGFVSYASAVTETYYCTQDGRVTRSGSGETFAVKIAGDGTAYDNTSTPNIRILADTVSPRYYTNTRYACIADTSALPDTAVISSATFGVRANGTYTSLAGGSMVVTEFNPSSTEVQISDYQKKGSSIYSANFSLASWSNTSYNNFTLTNTSFISKTGTSKLMLMTHWDAYSENASGWGSEYSGGLATLQMNIAGTGLKPFIEITHNTTPVAAFSGTPVSGTAPLSVTFTDASTYATSWEWYDGDTLFSTDQNPTEVFTAGYHSINLKAINGTESDWENKSNYLSISTAGGTYNGTYPAVFNAIPIRYASSSWAELRGGYGNSISSTPASLFNELDAYTCTSQFYYDSRPLVTFNTSSIGDGSAIISATLTATVAGASSGLGSPTFMWMDAHPTNQSSFVQGDFNKTHYHRMTDNITLATFGGGGTVTWTLTPEGLTEINKTGLTTFMMGNNYIMDNTSPTWVSAAYFSAAIRSLTYASGTAKPYLNVTYESSAPGVPEAEFTSNVTSCVAPCAVLFTDRSTNTPTSWNWQQSSDGATFYSTDDHLSQNPTHTFTSSGTYSIRLVAYNVEGSGELIKYDYIIVTSGSPLFTSNVTIGTPSLGVQFYDNSTNNPTAWHWYFWDNETESSSSQNPTQSFTRGTYDVRLNASPSGTAYWYNLTDYIKVGYAPTAHFMMDVVPGGGIFSVEDPPWPVGTLFLSDFGVTGDGTDETSEVQNGINYAYTHGNATVVFPRDANITVGQMRFKGGIDYYGNGSTLFLKASSHTGTSSWDWVYTEPYADVRNFTFHGNRNATGNGINTNGIMLQGNNLFENNTVRSVNSYSVNVYGTAPPNIIIRNNSIYDSKQYGIDTGCGDTSYCYGTNIRVTNNTIWNNAEVGIKIRGTNGALIDNNTITVGATLGSEPSGIRLYSDDLQNTNITIRNNTITGVGEDPSYCVESDNTANYMPITISYNTLSNCHTGIIAKFNDGNMLYNTISATHKCVDQGTNNTWTGSGC